MMRDKKYLIALFGILLLGFLLRFHNINFPSIGYHNGKENDYLSMAQEMKRTNDYITRRIYFLNAFDDVPQYKTVPQPPLVTYQILLAWKAMGENLWGPRLVNILFGIGSIFVIYLIGLMLFRERRLALYSAFLMAIMPLAVFFSRNLQPESPGVFFMLLGNYFYLRFITTWKKASILFGGLSFFMAWLYKFSFFIGVFPMIFCIPYIVLFKEKRRELLKYIGVGALSFILIPCVILWLKSIGQWEFADIDRVRMFDIFSMGYWQKYGKMIWWYIRGENFGLIYLTLSIIGTAVAFFRRKGLLDWYIIGWALTVIPYGMVFADYINQHNYYQMPFLGLICLSIAYGVKSVSEIVSVKHIHKRFLVILVMVIVTFSSIPFLKDSITRMHGTVYLGLDVAGETLGELTKQGDRIFLLTHAQGWGISRYARRFVGWEDDLELFKEREKKFNIKYICFYPAEFAVALKEKNPKLYDYIKENYRFKEIGVVDEPRHVVYIIVEKGKNPDSEKFLESFSGPMKLRTIYRLDGKYIFFYSVTPPGVTSPGVAAPVVTTPGITNVASQAEKR